MKKVTRIILASILFVSAFSMAVQAQESMKDLTSRVLEVALQQTAAMHGRLDPAFEAHTFQNGKVHDISKNSMWWCSGFFPGTLWYLYECTGDPAVLEMARAETAKLDSLIFLNTDHDIGFQFNCSYGNGYRLTRDPAYAAYLERGARKLAARFSPVTGAIKSWDNQRWAYPVIVDNMMNLELLMKTGRRTGDDSLVKVANTHAETTLRNHFRDDFTSYHLVSYSPEDGRVLARQTVQGYADESAWARGQAWGFYGFTMMADENYAIGYDDEAEKFLRQAEGIGRMLLDRLPEDGIPYWDFDAPDIPNDLRDASAGAIMASAFVKLSTLTKDTDLSAACLSMAEKQIRTLASKEYLAPVGENGNFLLKHGVGHKPAGGEVDVPLSYADYYFIEALVRYGKLSASVPVACAHLRLILREGEEDGIRKALAGGGILASADSQIMEYCDGLLSTAPLERIQIGRRILHISNEAIKRIFFLSYAYRMTGKTEYSERAVKEMLAISDFIDWNPSHYLDTGEMTMALAIGYDWLYDRMSLKERSIVRDAIVYKGLLLSEMKEYNHWYGITSNWNQVCNAGMVYGALAVREDEPALSDSVIVRCLRSNPRSLGDISPEGCYPEGYGYWEYGSSFEIMLVSALESSFGNDLGLLDGHDNFLRTSEFLKFMSTPMGYCFSFYDCGRNAFFMFMQAWLADRNNDLSAMYPEMNIYRMRGFGRLSRLFPMFLVYGSRIGLGDKDISLPEPSRHTYKSGGIVPLFIYREGWNSTEDTYLGVKGGQARSGHGHLDAGSFVFESDGAEWAVDLGSQDYYSLESKGVDLWNASQNSQRWDVFRIGPWSHNMLTVNGHRPYVDRMSPIVETWEGEGGRYGAKVDLHGLLSEDLDLCQRSVWVDSKERLNINDTAVAGEKDAVIQWAMCTPAEVEQLNSRTLKLTRNGKTRFFRVKGKNVALKVWPAGPMHDYDAPNPGYMMVGFDWNLPAGKKGTVKVTLSR